MPTGGYSLIGDEGSGVFQSLFFWMMPTGTISCVVQNLHTTVSILVLLDDAYRQSTIMLENRKRHVSILVLLDDAYRPLLRFCRLLSP